MGKKRTPPPTPPLKDLAEDYGCSILLVIAYSALISPMIVAAFEFHHRGRIGGSAFFGLLSLLCIMPLVWALAQWTRGKVWLYRAEKEWGANKFGILTISDSPNWQEYIQQNWIDRYGEHFVVMNYSEYLSWKPSLASRLLKHYLGRPRKYGTLNYNPAIVLLRGLRKPYIYRFFYAFRDAKHGNREALEMLEKHLFAEIEKRRKIAR